ncbi:partitioning defective 3 homolog B isoform X2 [Ambystoma mexicanum]|uniref:partitioning defective 3 homolog B isoform X2 n=1 Tax=Ambystoma mexicanum TaxID=8296 RepID=UPI0037E73E5B
MKVTVSFGRTLIVVPCKDGQLTVGDFTQQAAQRYLKTKEKDPGCWVKVHHLEYTDGGILDPDDVLADLVEDKDKLIAVYEEQESYLKRESTNGGLKDRLSPDPFEAEMTAQNAAYLSGGGEIEVTSSALRLGTPLLVRRSSDPALGPPAAFRPGASQPSDQSLKPPVTGSSLHGPSEDGEMDSIWQPEYLASHKTTPTNRSLTRTVNVSGEGGPLGIHVVPFYSSLSGRILGLHIRGIEEQSCSRRDGLFHENESIVKINSVDLTDRTFAQAQDLFRQAMKYENVVVEVLPPHNRELYEKCVIATLVPHGDEGVPKTKPPPPVHLKPTVRFGDHSDLSSLEMGGTEPLPSSRSPELTLLPKKQVSPSLSPLGFCSKKNARKLRIDLKKGPDGLGFTVVTKDSSVHGPGPIFVKNILPKGAAIRDGNLQSGDRILEVNGRDITGKTQEELVSMLRSTKQGETVSMVVARQEEAFLPRELKGEPEVTVPSVESKTQLTFEVPLNDTGSAGLGISLKGNKSRDTGADMGIFIKSIIHGGAAFKDGRLRVNDQLIAVNGEALLGKSNHEAMETLRRSMSMEGNLRGMIQLVILRKLDRQAEGNPKERLEFGACTKPAFDGNVSLSPVLKENDIYKQIHQERQNGTALLIVRDGTAENDVTPPLPPHPSEEMLTEYHQYGPGVDSAEHTPNQHNSRGSMAPDKQPASIKMKASKSMDLVEDESNISWLAGHKSDSPSKDLGPTLGLKKSSSLESLQTAVAEVKKNELPFHRPRPHMVRGRGCNESFRTAIDKSYDGPEQLEDDDLSDASSPSGRDTPSSESAAQGNAEPEDADKNKKDKKKKDKDKKKDKEKSKVKEKKKKEESEEQEKKAKKKGFGAMLRFGKKKEDKTGKTEQKGNTKNATIKEEELEKMKEERERIVAKHQELREKQARGLADPFSVPAGPIPDMDDDDMDPNYARVNHFREAPPPPNVYRPSSPPGTLGYLREVQMTPAEREHMEGMYAKISKPHHAQVQSDSIRQSAGNADRIQQLRKEYHQARREGFPLYEEDEERGRSLEYEQQWVPGKGPEGGSHGVRFEGMERQYASLPRRGPMEPPEYLAGPRVMNKKRDLPYYPAIPPAVHSSTSAYPRAQDLKAPDYRYPQYYPPPQPKGPLRQDVPPSPPQPQRAPLYSEVGRAPRPRGPSPDQYQYRSQDPRHKNPMTAAV